MENSAVTFFSRSANFEHLIRSSDSREYEGYVVLSVQVFDYLPDLPVVQIYFMKPPEI